MLRPRISLRLFLLLVLLCAAGMGWFASTHLQRYRHEAIIADRLAADGAAVERAPREPQWFWSLFGPAVAQRVAVLGLQHRRVGDDAMIEIGRIKSLEMLNLDGTAVTDFGLAQIRDLRNLVELSAKGLRISNSPPLGGMTKLIALDLANTDVAYLNTSDLLSLELLNLRATRVSDDGLSIMSPMPKLKTLNLGGDPDRPSAITDRGLAILTREKFPKLTRLYLYESEVTEAGVEEIKQRMPGLAVYRFRTVASGGLEEVSTPRPAATLQR